MCHVFIFAGTDGSVKETDVDMFIRHCFNVFIFGVYRDRPEENICHLIDDEKLFSKFYHGYLASATRGSPVESQFELFIFGHINPPYLLLFAAICFFQSSGPSLFSLSLRLLISAGILSPRGSTEVTTSSLSFLIPKDSITL